MDSDLLTAIRDENVFIYKRSAQRLKEDVGQEDEIARDYRGRLVYELVQNADDAMRGQVETGDRGSRLLIELRSDGLWVANSGRPMDEADVRGICGISASTKASRSGRKRASIGHKGMGFKSVLEISRSPRVYSTTYAFGFDEGQSLACLRAEGFEPRHAPLMRLPWSIDAREQSWLDLRDIGFNTAVHLPFASTTAGRSLERISEALRDLPSSTFLFLKHLSAVEIRLPDRVRAWSIRRERWLDEGWRSVDVIDETGLYRVRLIDGDGGTEEYLLAHDGTIAIGDDRAGLEGVAWEDVDESEVSVAVLLKDGMPRPLPEALVHVFLPTAERSPYPFLINGAFASGLSRQSIRVEHDPRSYNGRLLREAVRVFVETLLPSLCRVNRRDAVMLLKRNEGVESTLAEVLHTEVKRRLAAVPLVPAESGDLVALPSIVVPPLLPGVGEDFRRLLPAHGTGPYGMMPAPDWCDCELGRVLTDHGALEVSASGAAHLLASADPERSRGRWSVEKRVTIDPVLNVLQRIWEGYDEARRKELERAVRTSPLLPVDMDANGTWRRETVGDRSCFYPPKSVRCEVPLPQLCFLSQAVCWGSLRRQDRLEMLKQEMVAWYGLFGVQEFKFPEVMRASVLPAMAMDQLHRRRDFHDKAKLAAICQLSGKTSQGSPLPYERLGSQRQLFNLSRLELPCRAPDGVRWVPAYRVYLGCDWIGDTSVETLLDAFRDAGVTPIPECAFLVGPEEFEGLLAKYRSLAEAEASNPEVDATEEVGLDEDEDAPLPSEHRELWLEFFRWLGANDHLRAVHFHDVEDREAGWLTTEGLRRPQGWIFAERRVDADSWLSWASGFQAALESKLTAASAKRTRWFYDVHDLEHLDWLLFKSASDPTGGLGRAVCRHLAAHWPSLATKSSAVAAITERNPRRSGGEPKRAYDDERVRCGDNFWLWRLKRASFCPTRHGPRLPKAVWLRGREIARRSSRGGALQQVLPILDLDVPIAMAEALGIRAELTPSAFTLDDAEFLLYQLQRLSSTMLEDGSIDVEKCLRDVIRPACRELMELLTGNLPVEKRESVNLPAKLGDRLTWLPASKVFFAEQRRQATNFAVPIFVLEADPSARSPLQACFGVRVLEESLEWIPFAGDVALPPSEENVFRVALWRLGPSILARLGAERQEERQARRDARNLRSLLRGLVPVSTLDVTCKLDGILLGDGGEGAKHASSYVDRVNPECSFVQWSVWPPAPEDFEHLADAFCRLFGRNWYEPFLALSHTLDEADDDARFRLLEHAGAPTDLAPYRKRLDGVDDATPDPLVLPSVAGIDPGAPLPPAPGESRYPAPVVLDRPPHPLWSIDQLSIKGRPLGLDPETPWTEPLQIVRSGTAGSHGASGGTQRTDLSALDKLGMRIALSFERARLAQGGGGSVFDVSTEEKIAAAWPQLEAIFESQLLPNGVSKSWPGFDILSLGPDGCIDRMIELKSSGVAARIQECTWNEWNSASHSQLRKRYYLYLVGNLRSDLKGAAPYLRTVRDPFGQLRAEVVVTARPERKVQLSVNLFREAEEEVIAVEGVAPIVVSGSDEKELA